MRALVCQELGPISQLQVKDIDVPQPGPGELLIKVAGCAINFADTLVVQGLYQEKPPLPYIPGVEVSGVVDAVGEGVNFPKIGDRVMAFGMGGGFAEYMVVSAQTCLPISDPTADLATMAAFPIAYGTAHTALHHRGKLAAGETLIVNGAGSGTGLAAVEVAKAMGATVIALASTPEKRRMAQSKGADHMIDAGADDWVVQVKALVKEQGGANAAYDVVGGQVTRGLVSCLKPEGRVILVGFASGEIPALPANLLLVKNISLVGAYFGGLSKTNPLANVRALKELMDWIAVGKITLQPSETLSLDQAVDGLTRMANRQVVGRLVVTP